MSFLSRFGGDAEMSDNLAPASDRSVFKDALENAVAEMDNCYDSIDIDIDYICDEFKEIVYGYYKRYEDNILGLYDHSNIEDMVFKIPNDTMHTALTQRELNAMQSAVFGAEGLPPDSIDIIDRLETMLKSLEESLPEETEESVTDCQKCRRIAYIVLSFFVQMSLYFHHYFVDESIVLTEETIKRYNQLLSAGDGTFVPKSQRFISDYFNGA